MAGTGVGADSAAGGSPKLWAWHALQSMIITASVHAG